MDLNMIPFSWKEPERSKYPSPSKSPSQAPFNTRGWNIAFCAPQEDPAASQSQWNLAGGHLSVSTCSRLRLLALQRVASGVKVSRTGRWRRDDEGGFDLFGRNFSFEAFSSPSLDCTRCRREACGAHKQARLSLENIQSSISQAFAHYTPTNISCASLWLGRFSFVRRETLHHRADSSKARFLRLPCLIF